MKPTTNDMLVYRAIVLLYDKYLVLALTIYSLLTVGLTRRNGYCFQIKHTLTQY